MAINTGCVATMLCVPWSRKFSALLSNCDMIRNRLRAEYAGDPDFEKSFQPIFFQLRLKEKEISQETI